MSTYVLKSVSYSVLNICMCGNVCKKKCYQILSLQYLVSFNLAKYERYAKNCLHNSNVSEIQANLLCVV